MTEEQLKADIVAKAGAIVKALMQGKDCEVRKSANGVVISEFRRKVVAK